MFYNWLRLYMFMLARGLSGCDRLGFLGNRKGCLIYCTEIEVFPIVINYLNEEIRGILFGQRLGFSGSTLIFFVCFRALKF